MKWLLSVLATLLLVLFFNQAAEAKTEVIKFPDEELAAESVLPVFDQTEAVKKRNVITAKKIELGGFGGWNLNDAFFSPLNGGLWMTYHFSEVHAVQLMGAYYMPETSSYAKQLKNEQELNFDIVPQPQYLAMAAYELTPFYGKMSVTKQFVMNLAIYTTLGVGVVAVGNESVMAFSLGLGQKFFISKRF